MLNFLKKKDNENNNNLLTKIGSLLVHAAKIDQNYTKKEKEIIKKTLINLGAIKENIENLLLEAEKNENDSNQILDFTKEIKNLDEGEKIKIIEALWNIIYSDEKSDDYEANLMRRLSGLLYLNNKVVGDIKEKIKSKKL